MYAVYLGQLSFIHAMHTSHAGWQSLCRGALLKPYSLFAFGCRVPEECPQEVADVIANCLDENPSNRPSARDIIDQLGAVRETRTSF